MSKLKVIIRKVASPYSDKSGFAAEFLKKDGTRFFIAEQFGKELTDEEDEIARPRDIVHLVGYSFKFAQLHNYTMCKILKDFGAECLKECEKNDAARAEIAAARRARKTAAQAVVDLALPVSARKIDHEGKTDKEVKEVFTKAEELLTNRISALTPIFDSFKKSVTRLAGILECTDEERAELCGHYRGQNYVLPPRKSRR